MARAVTRRDPPMNPLAAWRRRLAGALDEDEATDLRAHLGALRTTPIGAVTDRARVEVGGVVQSLTHPPRTGGPLQLVVGLYDGSGTVEIVWLGRRSIPGIRPGVRLRVRGRVARRGGVPTIFNPSYDILPG